VVYCVGPRYGHLLDGLPALVASDLEESLIGEGTCTPATGHVLLRNEREGAHQGEAQDRTQLLLWVINQSGKSGKSGKFLKVA
jgi:hypothetical protein